MRRVFLTLLAAFCVVVAWGLWHGRAVADETSSAGGSGSVHLESAILLGDGGTLRMLNVPVADASGKAKCFDITCKMSAGTDGSIHMDSISAAPTTMVPNLADQFIPGTYVDGWGALYTLRGPATSIGGRTSWTFQRQRIGVKDDQKNLPPLDSAWTTGPTSGCPDIMNQPDIKTLPPGLAYGFSNGGLPSNYGWVLNSSYILGARQVGDSIQIEYFTRDGDWWKEWGTFVFTAYTPPPAEK
jgi:hypothetical protein